MRRIGLAVVGTLAGWLLAEGAVALLSGHSVLIGRLLPSAALDRAAGQAAAGQLAARGAPLPPAPDTTAAPAGPIAGTDPGLYCMDADPYVAYVLRHDSELQIFDGLIHSDHLGLRVRPGPPRGEGALRIDVLGDSVAFGYGLNDDQVLAARLEAELTGLLGPGGREVECRTVAIPGWNHRNAIHALLDHLDELRPDIVVYVPVANDLLDGDVIDERGRRRWSPDVSSDDPWLACNQGTPGMRFIYDAIDALRAQGVEEVYSHLGPLVVANDLSPEAARRLDEDVASIALLSRVLAARGSRLLLVEWLGDETYQLSLRVHMAQAGLDLPALPLFREVPSEFTLGFDPHPNAVAVAGAACWIAADLAQRGWVPALASASLPAAPPDIEELRADVLTAAQIEMRAIWRQLRSYAQLRPMIDFTTLEGVAQTYGGLNVDGSVGVHALFLLAPAGPVLRVRLAPIADRPDLYPLQVAVQIDDQPAGSLTLGADGEVEQVFAVPFEPGRVQPVEVRLLSERFVAMQRPLAAEIESFRPIRLSCGMP